MSMYWICLLALSAGVKSQFSPSPPPTVFTTQMMPSSSGSTNGNAVAGSCAARVGSVCEFSMDACCNTMNFGVSIPPTFVQSLDCSKAKVIFNTLQSQSFSDSQCSSMKIDIELSGGTNCACMAAPTPPPKIEVSNSLQPCKRTCIYACNNLSFFLVRGLVPSERTVQHTFHVVSSLLIKLVVVQWKVV
jgi:hypothetical protein